MQQGADALRRSSDALTASRTADAEARTELSALHTAVSAAAEALVAVGAKTDPMRIHNERVLSRLFSALEQRAAPAGGTRLIPSVRVLVFNPSLFHIIYDHITHIPIRGTVGGLRTTSYTTPPPSWVFTIDPMRIQNERVLSRLFSALEQRAAPAGSGELE